jgi:uncharacterized protein YecE (DUF72 family)
MSMARPVDASSEGRQAEQPARPVGNVYYGTCGWTDRTLIESGGFYPANVRSAEGRLRHYAREFPLVEVDATFYSPPSEENARLWAERAPPDFVFDIKAFGLLTHHAVDVRRLPEVARARLTNATLDKQRLYLRAAPAEIVELVWALHIDALRPLADSGKLGCVLFQFPHWFVKTRANVEYLREIRDRLPWRIAVEFRGGGWMEGERQGRTLALLEELGLAYVSVDEPQGFKSSTPPVVACTAPLAVLRLHGHNVETWEKLNITASERFRYLYSEDELRRWVWPARELAARAEQVHVLMNNCYRDYATRNAKQFAALLAELRATGQPNGPE